jgi:putative ABC transport system substrate-binding protein
MRRRDLLASAGAVAALCGVPGLAQQAHRPVIGFLNPASAANYREEIKAFEVGLRDSGFIVGQSVIIDYRWAEGQLSRLSGLAADLIRARVDVIVPTAGIASTLAARAATSTIPIVFAVGTDPVRQGLVANLHRPGGNATGLTIMTTELEAKRIGLLANLAPRGASIAVLVNGKSPEANAKIAEAETAARQLGAPLEVHRVADGADFAPAFQRISEKARLLAVLSDPLFATNRALLVGLAEKHRVPTIYQHRGFAEAGGLMSYGTNLPAIYRLLGAYTGRVLKGEKTAELPVQQPTRFEFVINLKTAKALGLEMPATLLAIADEVIE